RTTPTGWDASCLPACAATPRAPRKAPALGCDGVGRTARCAAQALAESRPGSAQAGAGADVVLALDQFDLVAVRVRDEGDDRGPALDRPGFARDLAAGRLDAFAGSIGIRHADGDVAVGGAHLVAVHAPVVGQLEFGLAGVAPVEA